ncbi:MAG: GntR family transcriptional regulator, partial [Ilumatobacteraceae bacterium]
MAARRSSATRTPVRHPALRLLDRSSALPLWAQLETELRRRLDSGEFVHQFPTDLELVNAYNVSRQTVREAIRALNREGVLHRQRGRGTVVVARDVEQPLGVLYSLFRTIENSGLTQRSTVIRLEPVTDSTAASAIGLDADTELLLLERIRFAGEATLAFDRTWLPLARTRQLLAANFEHTALYDELESRCGIRPDRGWEKITSVLPDKAVRNHLGLGARDPLLRLERGSFDGGEPVEYRITYLRAENFQLVSHWTGRGESTLNAERVERNH